MALNLASPSILDLVPESLSADPGMAAIVQALDPELAAATKAVPELLLFARLARVSEEGLFAPLARLAEKAGGLPDLPENVLDLLAWQLHVDGYEIAQSYEDKRRMVNSSLLMHRRKGTPWAVAEALRVLGYADARIIEGASVCRYDGEIVHDGAEEYSVGNRWAYFDVEVDLGASAGISIEAMRRIRAAVEVWKNVRSHLRALSWRTTIEDSAEMLEAMDSLKACPSMEDVYVWGFPTYNGSILHDNATFRRYDRTFRHNGSETYRFHRASGHLYENQLEEFRFGLTAELEEVVRCDLRYDGVHRHDGSYSYGINEAALLESSYPEENLELLVRRFCSYNNVHAYDGSINFNVREESYAF